MNDLKIRRYESEHGKKFPAFHELGASERERIVSGLRTRLSLPPRTSGLELVRELTAQSKRLTLNAEAGTFSLEEALKILGCTPDGSVLLNWYQFENVYEMRLGDISSVFYGLWNPMADYLDLIDSDLEWVISVDYDGDVWGLRFGAEHVP